MVLTVYIYIYVYMHIELYVETHASRCVYMCGVVYVHTCRDHMCNVRPLTLRSGGMVIHLAVRILHDRYDDSYKSNHDHRL